MLCRLGVMWGKYIKLVMYKAYHFYQLCNIFFLQQETTVLPWMFRWALARRYPWMLLALHCNIWVSVFFTLDIVRQLPSTVTRESNSISTIKSNFCLFILVMYTELELVIAITVNRPCGSTSTVPMMSRQQSMSMTLVYISTVTCRWTPMCHGLCPVVLQLCVKVLDAHQYFRCLI